jgi:Family of unknown function (DUF6058)
MGERLLSGEDLAAAVADRFVAVNGAHPMTHEDDDYVDEWFVTVEDVAAAEGLPADEIRSLMIADVLPIPSYIRSDGAQMVPGELLELMREAGVPGDFPAWFRGHWETAAAAEESWNTYLSGQLVCLRHVTPETMKRKDELVAAISAELDAGVPDATRINALADELDSIEPPFAPYDRRRFGGPVSRDRLIDDVRVRYPIAVASPTKSCD